jgi:hypothetical protein
MTEYEIAELAMSTQELFWQQMQVAQGFAELAGSFFERYMTVMFGYLIVAHLIGARLTRVQAGILTALYLFWLARLATGVNVTTSRMLDTLDTMKILQPDLAIPSSPTLWMFTLLLLSTVASLYFMWNVRHPKTE